MRAALHNNAISVTKVVVGPGEKLECGPHQNSIVSATQNDRRQWQAGGVSTYSTFNLLNCIQQICSILGQTNIGEVRSREEK
jgi:hypothetical protein